MERKEMLPSGSTTPVGGNQNVSQPALHRTNSGLLAGGGQGGGVGVGATSQGFPALISPRSQYCNVNSMLGNLPSVPVAGGNFNSIGMTQAFSNCGNVASQSNTPNVAGVVPNRALAMADSLPISGVGGGMNILGSSGTMNVTLSRPGGGSVAPVTPNGHHYSNSSPQVPQDQQQQGQQTQLQQQQQQLEQQKFQQGQQQQHPQDIVSGLQGPGQSILGKRTFQQIQGQHLLGIGGNQQQQLQPYRSFPSDQQQLQLRNLAPMKLDPQQIRNLTSVKLEHPGEQSLLLPQQQQLLQFSRQPPQQIQIQAAAAAAQMSMLQQQRMLQQQQLLNAFPQSRSQLQQQNMPVALPQKSPVYESGMCARRLMQYMFHQQHRPEDNNIDFWRKFVSEYFAPHAKKRWCFALYGSGRQTTGVFPQDVWHCEICGAKPGKGFETTVEVLPRLSKIKYDSGTMEELLYVDMPKERATSSGHIVLEYGKAIQESVFEQLRVVRDGQLRIVFSSDLKICSWEFCARGHEDLIPRKLLVPQVSQLGAIAQKYQSSIQNGSTNLSTQELQTNCNMFVATARQLAKTLEVPLVNDLGYTKRYVRCLQISEVVDSMKDLIDFSQENKIGPLESLQRFPRRTTNTGTRQNQATQQQEPNAGTNAMINASNSQHLTVSNEQNAGQTTITQNAGTNPMSHSTNSVSLVSHANSSNAMVGVIHQNSMNNRTNSSTSFTSSVQVPSVSSVPVQQSQVSSSSSVPNSSSSISNTQVSPPSTITSTSSQLPSVSGSTNLLQQQSVATGDLDQADPDGSVPYFIQEIMMSSQLNGGSAFQSSIGGTAVGNGVCNDVKPLQVTGTANGSVGLKSATGFGMNGFSNNANIEFNNVGAIDSIPSSLNGIRHNMAITRNNVTLNGRTTGASLPQNLTIQDSNLNLQDFGGNRLLNGLSSPNNFNNLQFDWKPS